PHGSRASPPARGGTGGCPSLRTPGQTPPKEAKRKFRCLGHYTVSADKESVFVQLSGQPIIHSTKRGFRRRPGCLPNTSRAPFPGGPFQSRAFGVGSAPRRASDSRLSLTGPVRPAAPPRLFP